MENVFHNILVETANEPLISFGKFSDFNKLCKTTTFIFKFINEYKRINDLPDSKQSAKRYLIKIRQLQAFNKEIAYSKDCDKKRNSLTSKKS